MTKLASKLHQTGMINGNKSKFPKSASKKFAQKKSMVLINFSESNEEHTINHVCVCVDVK